MAMGRGREKLPYYDEEPVIAGAVKYHRESCWAVGMIGPNRKRLRSWKQAIELGLEPCGACRPFGYEEWKAGQKSKLSSGAPAPVSPASDVAPGEVEPDEGGGLISSRESIPEAFEAVCKTLRSIAANYGLELDPRTSPDQLIERLSKRDKANFPNWFVTMLHLMRLIRNRVVHPPEADPVTDKQVAAWAACFEAFQEWAETWGWKK